MTPLAPTVAALRLPDYRRLVLAFLVSATGVWASGIVLDVIVFTRTHELGWVAAMVVANWVPGVIASPLAGVVADRIDRRRVATVSAALSGLAGAAVLLIVVLHAPVAVLLPVTAVAAVVRTPYRPATGALTPEVVEPAVLPTANAILGALENVVVVVGPAIGGLLLLLHRPEIALALNAVGWLVAAGISAGLRVRSRGGAEPGESPIRAVVEGVRALGAAPTAGVLLVFATLDALLANAYPVLYLPISGRLGMGTGGYGWLLTAAAAGGVVGAVLGARCSGARRLAPIIVGGIALQALPYAITALTRDPAAGIGLQALSGAGEIFVDVLALIAIQREVPSGRLSRVLALLDMAVLLASAVGSVAAANLLDVVPLGTALLVIGIGSTAVAVGLSPLLVRADRAAAVRRREERPAVVLGASAC